MNKRIIFPVFILLISTAIIFFQFPNLPKNLSYDEVQFAKLALSLDGKPYTPYSPLATGHSTLYFYVILLSFKIFGINNFALRFPSAFFGVLNVMIFYFLMQFVFKQQNNKIMRQFNNLTIFFPFFLSVILVSSHWYFNFSRFSFEATFLLFLELTSLYCLYRYIDKSKHSSLFLILSGIFAGLAYNSYTPGRIFFLLPLTFIFFTNFKNLINFKNFKIILYFFIPFIIIITPLTAYLTLHPDDRVDKQFFPKNTEMKITEKADYFLRNIQSIILMFNIKGDINGRHNYPAKPALNTILGILFISGLLLAIKNLKKLPNQIFFAYFIIALIPATLTYPWENPNMLRTFTVIPSVIYFIGNSFIWLLNYVKKDKKHILLTIIIVLLVLSSIYELRTYFLYQVKVFPQAFELKYELKTALNMKSLP